MPFVQFKNICKHQIGIKMIELVSFVMLLLCRAVVSGVVGGVPLTLFQPEGADYAQYIIGSTPGFGNLTTALLCSTLIMPMQKIKK